MFHSKGPTLLELIRQGLSSTERGYDQLAPKFDYTPFRTPQPVLDAAAPYIGEPGAVGRALDLCCGTGAAMSMLRPLCRDMVVGVDFSQGMLEEARRSTASSRGDAPLRFVRGDVLRLPFEAEFDVAVCFGAFGHILPADEPRFVEQVARALRPGGVFLFATSYLPSPLDPAWWLSRAFNGVMRVRNLFIDPPFVMYYLTFVLPRVRSLLEESGFTVKVHEQAYSGPWRALRLVEARIGGGIPRPA